MANYTSKHLPTRVELNKYVYENENRYTSNELPTHIELNKKVYGDTGANYTSRHLPTRAELNEKVYGGSEPQPPEPQPTDILLGTWKINIEPSLSREGIYSEIDFNYGKAIEINESEILYYSLLGERGRPVYDALEGWEPEAARTITITDTSALTNRDEFTAWLTANAVKQSNRTGLSPDLLQKDAPTVLKPKDVLLTSARDANTLPERYKKMLEEGLIIFEEDKNPPFIMDMFLANLSTSNAKLFLQIDYWAVNVFKFVDGEWILLPFTQNYESINFLIEHSDIIAIAGDTQ